MSDILTQLFSQIVLRQVIFVGCFLVGVIMEYWCMKQFQDIAQLSAPHCTVVRNGEEMEIESCQLVPGDLVVLKGGDTIPADGRIVQAKDLLVNQANLTGEGRDVPKVAVLPEHADDQDEAGSSFP